MPKSVAIIGTRGYPSYYGGFETAVRKLAPFLVDAGWSVRVYGRKGSTKPEDSTRDTRVHSTDTPGWDNKSLSTLTFGLTAFCHALFHRPDVALIMNVANGFWLPLLRLRGIPSVVNVDGIEWERAKWGRLAKIVFKLGAYFTARFGTVLISDSKEIQRRWKLEFKRDSVFIPYGGEFPDPLPIADGLTEGSYALMVARFVPENTVSEFFAACEDIARDHPVVIVGSSGYGGELESAAANLTSRYPNVTWLGHVSDDTKLMSLWQHAGAYFHGHSVGGTNPALVQAMACASPVVARKTPYNLEVLGNGEYLVDPDSAAVAAGVRRMLINQEERNAAKVYNRDRAWKYYNWRGVCEAYERVISEVSALNRREGFQLAQAPLEVDEASPSTRLDP
ncbi:glycosyltransferase [Arthrobacter sp. ISL-85]|uniref:glycosyltransferase n=1 Tax=Arthrobacter sp. ISL-85 TaxID=2819115 RepID=UPI001BE769D8|nr:glycosyltransferase [Arthrobacter sp. ISL-85]MBT2568954.1 glycosyltransferase [Arthrobacter sp. ISL-85]